MFLRLKLDVCPDFHYCVCPDLFLLVDGQLGYHLPCFIVDIVLDKFLSL